MKNRKTERKSTKPPHSPWTYTQSFNSLENNYVSEMCNMLKIQLQ